MRHFEIAIGHVVVADERTAIGPKGHGGVLADLTGAIQGGDGRSGAGPVGTVSHLEIAVRRIVVADEAQAVRPKGHGSELADVTWAVQGGERESRTLKTGIVRGDTRDQSDASEKSDS